MTSSPFAFLRRWNLGQRALRSCVTRRGDWFALALEDGKLAVLAADDSGEDPQIFDAHRGPSLAFARDADEHAVLSGGAGGRLLIVEPGLPVVTPLFFSEGKPITHVAATRQGYRAFFSEGKLRLLGPEGRVLGEPILLPEPPLFLSFAPRGRFLAAFFSDKLLCFDAHALAMPEEETPLRAAPKDFLWKPDGTKLYLLSEGGLLEEASLDAEEKLLSFSAPFRVPDGFSGLSSLALSAGDRFMLARGEKGVVCWPLSKDAVPAAAFVLGDPSCGRAAFLAPHPSDDLVALGYENGAIVLAPLDGRKELALFPPVADEGARVVGLVWNRDGDCLHAVLENGHVFLFTHKSITRFVRGQRL